MTTSTETTDKADEALRALLNSELPFAARHKLLAEIRARQPDLAKALETSLIERCCHQTGVIEELKAVVGALRQMTEKLTSPALREGLFLGRVSLADGRTLARIVHGNQETLVSVTDDEMFDTLHAGDRVLLTSEANAVLGKSDQSPSEPGECAVAERWLDADRLLLRHRDQTLVVRTAAGLSPETVKPGDKVRLDRNGWLAMEHIAGSQNTQYVASDNATSLPPEALAGYDDLRDGALRRIGCAIAHPELAATYGIRSRHPWILLGGPPGVGKTTLARVIAGTLQRETGRRCRIHKINGAELLSPYVGETEQRIKTLVREAAETEGWSILFIDEVDAIARTRGATSNVHSDRFLSTWLSELEGFEGRTSLILIAATNRLDTLDAAFRERFSWEIHVPRPRMDDARAIFGRHLTPEFPYRPNGPLAAPTRQSMIDTAVARLYLPNAPGAAIATLRFRDGRTRPVLARDLMSGRLIEQICTHARERAFQRHADGGDSGLTTDDMEFAVAAVRERLRVTLTPQNVHGYLTDLPTDVGVVSVEPAPRAPAGGAFIRQVTQ